MKRTCDRCVAFECFGYECKCTLNYKTTKEYSEKYMMSFNYKPIEECPKPLTNDKYIECIKELYQRSKK